MNKGDIRDYFLMVDGNDFAAVVCKDCGMSCEVHWKRTHTYGVLAFVLYGVCLRCGRKYTFQFIGNGLVSTEFLKKEVSEREWFDTLLELEIEEERNNGC
jgi:hypothetical protein